MQNTLVDRALRKFGNNSWEPLVKALRESSSLVSRSHRRRFHAYGVGLPRSGTTSLSRLFEKGYRAAHEYDSFELIDLLTAPSPNETSSTKARRRRSLKARDARLWLEMDSSHIHVYFLKELLELFPRAKFIFTTRDCFSWLDSIINKELASSAPAWKSFEQFRYLGNRPRDSLQFDPTEAELEKLERFPVANYFDYWRWHNQTVLDTIPADRLFVLRVNELGKRLPDLAGFLDINPASLDVERQHANTLKQRKFKTFELLPPDFLDARMNETCAAVMKNLFPETNSVRDILA